MSGRESSHPAFGNYQGYYVKRPAIYDARLSSLPPLFFANKSVLDVGCNEGLVSIEIAQQWDAKRVIGVDVDPRLIAKAWKRRGAAWSAQCPQRTEGWQDAQDGYFPLSLIHSLGTLPSSSVVESEFPRNIIFRTANWGEAGIIEDSEGYDVILALSVSKWIHLNGGDKGLIDFFQRIWDSLKPGGQLVFEPQPWESYIKAKRMSQTLNESFCKLELRPEGFPDVLGNIGFVREQTLGDIGEGGFRRPVDIYTKPLT